MTEPIGLVTDSTADLPPGLAMEENIAVVPAIVVVEGRSYEDSADLTRQEFYHRLPSLRAPATTAAPPAAAFERAYESLLASEDDARQLAERLAQEAAKEAPIVVDVTAVIGVHVGPRCLGVVGLLR